MTRLELYGIARLNWVQQQFRKVPAGMGLQKVFNIGDALKYETVTTGWGTIRIQAERRAIPMSLRNLSLIDSQSPTLWGNQSGFYNRVKSAYKYAASSVTDGFNIETRQGRVNLDNLDVFLAKGSYTVLSRETTDVLKIGGKAIAGELLIGVGLDAGFQAAGDWNNPFLTNSQRLGRAGVAGISATLSGVAGFGASSAVIALVGPGVAIVGVPAFIAGLGVTLGADYLIGTQITPLVYQRLGLEASRDLQVLR